MKTNILSSLKDLTSLIDREDCDRTAMLVTAYKRGMVDGIDFAKEIALLAIDRELTDANAQ